MREPVFQALLWPFINAYKKHTGEIIGYVAMRQRPERLREYIERARALPVAELRELAERLQEALEEMPTEPPVPRPAAQAQFSDARDDAGREEYRQLLEQVLAQLPVGVGARQALDRFCRIQRLDRRFAEAEEQALRQAHGLPSLNWAEEYRAALLMMMGDGRLSESDRLQLFETYLKNGRLSILHAERILEEETAAVEIEATVGGRRRSLLWPPLAAAVVGAVAALLWMQLGRPMAVVEDAIAETAPAPAEIRVAGSIRESTLWRAGTTYVLTDVVFVENGATLDIEPGVRVLGEHGSALVVTRGAKIGARGTADKPIVFTSALPAGERQRGDWGGVVLLGAAPVNRPAAQIEGIPAEDSRGAFGGTETGANCGVLEYVRIEFAGYEAFANNELNGLTLGGCGHKSIVRHVQVHKSLDDGIELFGGDVDLRKVVVTGAADDSIDWDMGWAGRAQFVVAQQHGDAGDNAFEADNGGEDPDALPRSGPVFYNVSLIGSRNPERAQRAMTLRRGTGGTFRNVLITGFPMEAIDVRDAATAALVRSGELSLAHALLYDIGADGQRYAAPEEAADDDAGFDEAAWLAESRQVAIGADPMLRPAAFDPVAPNFVPVLGSPAGSGAAPIPKAEFFDEAAGFVGAFRPGAPRSWLDGWTAFPTD